jgi:sulfate adenylyltransferase subunit 1 (EFTu-like GTPase family)
MPITYHIDPAAGMLFVFGDGVITQAERLAAVRSWMSDDAFRPGLKTLCDFSAAVSVPTLTDLMSIATFIEERAQQIGRKKLALVTAAGQAHVAARQFRTLARTGPLDVSVFGNRREAMAWLQQPAR